MSFVKHRFGLRIIVSAISFVCVVLASVMIQVQASNGLLKTNPSVELKASKTSITYPCGLGRLSRSRSCPTEFDSRISLTALAKGFSKQLVYSYSVTSGQVVGEGSEVTWNLTGLSPGYYTVTVEVHDNKRHRAGASVTLTIANCGDCSPDHSRFCPIIAVDCYDQVKAGTPITCKVAVGSTAVSPITYEWSARDSRDEDLSGRIKRTGEHISIPTNDLAGRTVYTTVEVKGLDPTCNATASSSTRVKP